jgi:hypothetical protein
MFIAKATRELAKYKLDFLAVQGVKWGKVTLNNKRFYSFLWKFE